MKVRGIKRGQNIEILETINNIPDGTEIIVDLGFIENQITKPQQTLTEAEKLAKLNQLFGAWKNQPELWETSLTGFVQNNTDTKTQQFLAALGQIQESNLSHTEAHKILYTL
ncbi:hypothetical protein [Sphaerospermopsis aphanizomenoides]|uniref:hypothetical protein n=1 Tax=Sphaerospermopsis aphanizomenoides TaxID=459663 RepID=UPI001F37EB85|nr:hypothetical protein [Sphaerospermopsis aphanizomenoides]